MNLIKLSVLSIGLLFNQLVMAQDDIFNLDENYEIAQNGTIYLNTDDANIRIKGSDRKDVHVKVYRKTTRKGVVFGKESFEFKVIAKNGDLYIRDIQQQVNVSVVGYISEEYEILIESPENISLDIEGDDDDYEINRINGNIAMDVDDGDAKLTNCGGDSFDFDFDDGDLFMDEAKGSLKLTLDDGDANIRNADFIDIDVTADDGDIELETALDDNGNYTFRVDDGDIELTVLKGGGTFQIYHDDGHISASQAFIVQKEEDDETRFKLSKGTARVKMRADDASIRLREI